MRLLPLLAFLIAGSVFAQPSRKAVVFSQPGFPTIDSAPIEPATLTAALTGFQASFADLGALNQPATLANAALFVLPYGSAVPAESWKSILAYLNRGGNLLVLGGQPLRVPVLSTGGGGFRAERPQDSYANSLGLRHTYEVPVPAGSTFTWRAGYAEGAALTLKANRFFAAEGRLDGLGYMASPAGQLVAAPVIFANHSGGSMYGGRLVALDFEPAPGFWASTDGVALIARAADYAAHGSAIFSVETLFATIRPGERPALSVHLQRSPRDVVQTGEIRVQLLAGGKQIEAATVPASEASTSIFFQASLPAGFYEVTATWREASHIRESSRNGFWVSSPEALQTGPKLGVHGDSITLDGQPFLPVGTNYFTTEENGWDFSGPRNAAVWERDFADMRAHGVNFVRTGVWMPNTRFLDGDLHAVNERFLRNLEAYLLSAQRHGIAVNFTFFAFNPRSGDAHQEDTAIPPPNPYLDPDSLRGQQAYIRSVLARFGKVPFLSWDLINEPSVANPRHIFAGNYPNNDPAERDAWHRYLRVQYPTLQSLADAWSVTPEDLGSFDAIPLPSPADLTYERSGDPRGVRALDYNLFAQEIFSNWARLMHTTIREGGSTQLVDVGQDEGGVTNRVLNHFYAGVGLSFTTNHTYWEDDALLWDSVAAKIPGVPNITGETGYQPSWAPDGAWRYDEFTGLALMERKWALGFAAGSTGAMQWDWARETDFGMQRSDGSAKVWEDMMRDLGAFAKAAAPYTGSFQPPQVALVLPQSLQLSTLNSWALQAQQTAVRTLYQRAHGSAYAVGEYQIERLGSPRLILLPSPLGLSETAWQGIEARVRDGAVLLVTGPFDGDPHLHPTARASGYRTEPLQAREPALHWPGGDDTFTFPGKAATVLSQASLPGGATWKETSLGKGTILFAAYPLELSQNAEALGRVYAYAMRKAGVQPLETPLDPGILICPTEYRDATLYVLTSETSTRTVTFHDRRSDHDFSGTLSAGRAALLLVGSDGQLLARYHWQ